jgi:glycosyltransferase involved in cell wall biosynthesis
MKIAMLLDNPFTNDKRVYNEAKSLVDNGYNVTVICRNEIDESLPTEENINGIGVKRLFKYNLGTTVLIDKNLLSHFDLYNNLTDKFDVYHCHDTETWPIGYILSKRDNAKFICDSHEFFPDYICSKWHNDEFKYELTKMLVRARGDYIKYADKVITVSEPIADELMKSCKLDSIPTVLYNSRRIKENEENNNVGDNILRKKYNISNSKKIILFTGILEYSRGINILIKAMKSIDNAVLILVGYAQGDYLNELKKIIDDFKVKDKIIFTGFVPNKEVLNYCRCSDLLAYLPIPLVKSIELSAPNKFFDYIFAGKPMIVSNLVFLGEVVKKYGLGEAVPVNFLKNTNLISSSINSILANEDILKRCQYNLEFLKKKYCWEQQEKKLLEIYNTLSLGESN